jgi:hypothetical protein
VESQLPKEAMKLSRIAETCVMIRGPFLTQ